jgi:hypothetical protein
MSIQNLNTFGKYRDKWNSPIWEPLKLGIRAKKSTAQDGGLIFHVLMHFAARLSVSLQSVMAICSVH